MQANAQEVLDSIEYMRHQLFEILNMDKALREKQKTYATANESLTLENAQLAGENTDSNEQLDGLQHQRSLSPSVRFEHSGDEGLYPRSPKS